MHEYHFVYHKDIIVLSKVNGLAIVMFNSEFIKTTR